MTNYSDSYDECKAFMSRIPAKFTEERLKIVLIRHFGDQGSKVDANDDKNVVASSESIEVSLLAPKEIDSCESKNNADKTENNKDSKNSEKHRGCAFVTFPTMEMYQRAVSMGSFKDKSSDTSKRKYTMYIRPVIRNDREDIGKNGKSVNTDNNSGKKLADGTSICFLWERSGQCKYGTSCKFEHPESMKRDRNQTDDVVEGTTKEEKASPKEEAQEKSKQDKRSSSHNKPLEKHCINWKTKGKCRTKNCPFRHDESVKERLLEKKKRKAEELAQHTKSSKGEKKKQPLWCRVFGLNYESTEETIRELFEPCGTIVKIDFPTFEDSGRSKGYCGVLFQSPKAVEKAVETLDGTEIDGRWIRVQAGKMMLSQWERREKDRAFVKDSQHGRGTDMSASEKASVPLTGEFGQKVKKRKKHGYKNDQ